MHTINVAETLVTPCFLAAEMGEMLFQLIQQELTMHNEIEIDFSGYHYVSETFLYHSLGKVCLVNKFDEAAFKRKIHVTNFEVDDWEELEEVLDNVRIQLSVQQI
jgi:hypothetical protein